MKIIPAIALAGLVALTSSFSKADVSLTVGPCHGIDTWLTFAPSSSAPGYWINIWNEDESNPVNLSIYFEKNHWNPEVSNTGIPVDYATYQYDGSDEVSAQGLPEGTYHIDFLGSDIGYFDVGYILSDY